MSTTIAIASTNPVKLEATRRGFRRMFPGIAFVIESVAVTSGVSEQPMSDNEALTGAVLRARGARDAYPDAYAVGIEGGVEETPAGMMAFAWVVVLHSEQMGSGRTGAFYLPCEVANLVRAGTELGEADDIVFGRENSKQANGAIGLLTSDALDRTGFYTQAVIMALLPFKNPHLTWR